MHTAIPVMGWNSWNTFGEKVCDSLIRQETDAIVENGLDKLGYEYVVIDDCWCLKERDEHGRLVPDPIKFPYGIKALADYVHSRGLKLGIYSCSGTLTCARYPGSYGYEFTDAQTFAEWEVDFLKYDNCYKPEQIHDKYLYRKMGIALANCGRDILYSACSWGVDRTFEWIGSTGATMWRSTGDIVDSWESIKKGILQQMDVNHSLYGGTEGVFPFGGIGCFNDMDMLVVGMHGKGNVGICGCTEEEYKTQFSTWAMFGSPLFIGCDIREMDEPTRRILTNKAVIDIARDKRYAQPFIANYSFVSIGSETPTFARLLDNGDIAILILNLADDERVADFRCEQLGLEHFNGIDVELTDLWTGERVEMVNRVYLTNLGAHCCRLLRLKIKR